MSALAHAVKEMPMLPQAMFATPQATASNFRCRQPPGWWPLGRWPAWNENEGVLSSVYNADIQAKLSKRHNHGADNYLLRSDVPGTVV